MSGGSFSNLSTADVYVKDACGATYGPVPYSGSNGIYATGLPFGALTVCADDNKTTQRYETGTVTNTATGASVTLQIDSFSGGADLAGACTGNGPWS